MHPISSQQAVELFQILVAIGATPGEDFSVDTSTGQWSLSDRAYQLLKQVYPDVDWDADLSPISVVDHDQAIAVLHEHLGIDFVPRLLDCLHHRLNALPLRQAAWYMRQVLGGVEQRTHLSLYDLLHARLDAASRARLDYVLWHESHPEPCGLWMQDVILAAGGSVRDAQCLPAEVVLSERGMRLLAAVWMGDYDVYGALAS